MWTTLYPAYYSRCWDIQVWTRQKKTLPQSTLFCSLWQPSASKPAYCKCLCPIIGLNEKFRFPSLVYWPKHFFRTSPIPTHAFPAQVLIQFSDSRTSETLLSILSTTKCQALRLLSSHQSGEFEWGCDIRVIQMPLMYSPLAFLLVLKVKNASFLREGGICCHERSGAFL